MSDNPLDLANIMNISTAGMQAQTSRLRTVAENLANANSLATTPGGDPYRRKLVTFSNVLDKATGENLVRAGKIVTDKRDFEKSYDPGNPVADAQGYVSKPNVNPLVEAMDMREAERTYQANLAMANVSKSMLLKTIGMLQ